MANFLDDLSVYNAKAAAAIALAVKECKQDKANLMSSLKTTANDTTLSEEIRLNALTALINIGDLLDIPLPPYFPLAVTYADTQTYIGIHNDLSGLQGGGPGEYYHLTEAERTSILNKASINDISFANLLGSYTDNPSLVSGFALKQDALNGNGFVKASGGTITYDNSTYLTTISGIAAGGDLEGFYPSPTLSNAAVIGQVLTGFNGSASSGTITSSDSILSAMEKLNANIDVVASGTGTINEISFALPSSVFSFTAGPYTSGAAPLSGTFINQTQNYFFAGPTSGGTGQPLFRAFTAGDLPASGATAGTYGSSSVIPVLTVDAYGRVTSISNVTSASGGQVDTVTMSVPAGTTFSAINGGTSTNPIVGFSLPTQSANTVWAGPASGAAATPNFRALVAADIPSGIPLANISGLQAALDAKISDGLGTSLIFMGNGSNKAVQTEVAGDLTASYSVIGGINTGTFTIADEAVTYAKFQNIPDSALTTQRPILLGRFDAGQGVMQQLTLSGDFTLNGTTGEIGLLTPNPPALVDVGDLLTSTGSNNLVRLSLPSPNDGYLLMPYAAASTPACGLIWGEVQGDITYTVDDTTTPGTPFGAFSIGANKVTLGKIEQIGLNTILGNNTANPDDVAALSASDVTAMLNQFGTSTQGMVPPSGGVGATYYLNANGAWTVPAGGGGGGTTTNPLTIGSGLSGTAATFNGSAAVTISLNTGNANTWSALQTFTAATGIYLGEVGTSSGNLRFRGSGSGFVQFTAPTSPTNQSYILPTAYPVDSTNKYLVSDTSGNLSWTSAGSGSGTVASGSQYQLAYYAGAGTTTTVSGLSSITPSSALVSDANGLPVASTVSTTQLQYLASASGTVSFGAGGTVAYIGTANSWTSGIKQTFSPSATTAGINVGSLAGQPSSPANGDLVYNTSSSALQAYINGAWVSLGSGGGGGSPGGANGDFQYKNGSAFDGSSLLRLVSGFVVAHSPKIGDSNTTGHFHMHSANSVPTGINNYLTMFWQNATRILGFRNDNETFRTYIQLTAPTADRTITLPDASGNVVIDSTIPSFNNGTSAGEIWLKEATANGSDYVAIKSPALLASPWIMTLPTGAGTSGYGLITDGSGNTSWAYTGSDIINKYRRNYTQTTITNPTGNTKIESLFIPANTFSANDQFFITYRLISTVTTSAVNVFLGINTADSVSGVTNLSAVHGLNAGVSYFSAQSMLVFTNTGSPNLRTQAIGTNATTPVLTINTIDWTVNQYLIFYCQASANRTLTNLGITTAPM
jgi:hypothetical protein